MTEEYIIKTEQFEGPLDVLLTFIEKRKLLINHVSLAAVTEEFISFIDRLHEPLEIKRKTSFVAIASILLLIKAKSLLPVLDLSPEEQVDVEDLEKRLKMLELMRRTGKRLEEIFGKRSIYPQGNFRKEIRIFAPSSDINVQELAQAIQQVLTKLPKPEKSLPQVRVRKTVTIEEMMDTLVTRIKWALKMTFTHFSQSKNSTPRVFADEAEKVEFQKAEKQHIVVSFLALLELVKQNMITVDQPETFSEISIEGTGIHTPEYTS